MKYVWAILSILSFVSLFGQEMPVKKLTLVECQQICLKTSETLSIRELVTRIEEEKIQQIKGINTPKVMVDADYGTRNNHLGSIAPNRMKGGSDEDGLRKSHAKVPDKIRSVHGPRGIMNAKASLIVPIYDSGYVANRVSSQEFLVDAVRYSRDRLEQKLLNEVAQSFFLLLQSRKIEGVIQASLSTLRQELETTRDLFSIGYVTENDVLVIEVQLAEREQELIQARNNSDMAYASLNRLMSQDLDHSFDIEDVSETPLWDESYSALKEKADRDHPDLKKITAEKQSNIFDYQAIRAEILPQVKGIVSYNTSSNSSLLHKQWVAGGIGIQIPIFDGGIVESKLKQKDKEIESLGLSYTNEQENIHLDIKRAFLETRAAQNKIPVAEKSTRVAEENLRMTQEQYQEGLISSDDYLNNEERLAQARSNYYQALYRFYMAKSELDFAAGIISLNKT